TRTPTTTTTSIAATASTTTTTTAAAKWKKSAKANPTTTMTVVVPVPNLTTGVLAVFTPSKNPPTTSTQKTPRSDSHFINLQVIYSAVIAVLILIVFIETIYIIRRKCKVPKKQTNYQTIATYRKRSGASNHQQRPLPQKPSPSSTGEMYVEMGNNNLQTLTPAPPDYIWSPPYIIQTATGNMNSLPRPGTLPRTLGHAAAALSRQTLHPIYEQHVQNMVPLYPNLHQDTPCQESGEENSDHSLTKSLSASLLSFSNCSETALKVRYGPEYCASEFNPGVGTGLNSQQRTHGDVREPLIRREPVRVEPFQPNLDNVSMYTTSDYSGSSFHMIDPAEAARLGIALPQMFPLSTRQD
ncbi:hypothetical protein Ahia01_000505600, partial [Argonauta hians]